MSGVVAGCDINGFAAAAALVAVPLVAAVCVLGVALAATTPSLIAEEGCAGTEVAESSRRAAAAAAASHAVGVCEGVVGHVPLNGSKTLLIRFAATVSTGFDSATAGLVVTTGVGTVVTPVT